MTFAVFLKGFQGRQLFRLAWAMSQWAHEDDDGGGAVKASILEWTETW